MIIFLLLLVRKDQINFYLTYQADWLIDWLIDLLTTTTTTESRIDWLSFSLSFFKYCIEFRSCELKTKSQRWWWNQINQIKSNRITMKQKIHTANRIDRLIQWIWYEKKKSLLIISSWRTWLSKIHPKKTFEYQNRLNFNCQYI